jgi:hypothetical protein
MLCWCIHFQVPVGKLTLLDILLADNMQVDWLEVSQ